MVSEVRTWRRRIMSETVGPAIPLPARLWIEAGNEGQSWRRWRHVFDSYAVLSGLADKAKEVQMATFVTCLGAEAVDVLNELPFARDDDEKDLETVLKRMDGHFIGQTNIIFKRFKFYERKQEEGETMSQYIAAYVSATFVT